MNARNDIWGASVEGAFRRAHCHERSAAGPETSRHRRSDGDGRWIRLALRARQSGCRSRDVDRAQETCIRTSRTAKRSRRCFSGQDGAIFCLGTYTGAVPDAEFYKVTVDYTVDFSRVLHTASPAAVFSFLSGNGADPTQRSRLAFARYKGEAENALLATGFPHVYIFRPGYIYPVQPRKEPNFSYRLLRAVYPAFRVLFPNLVIPADDLARAMVDAALHGTGERSGSIFENPDIRAMADAGATHTKSHG